MVLLPAWELVADSSAAVEGIEDTEAVVADNSEVVVLGLVVAIGELIEMNKVEELDQSVDENFSHC